MARDITNFANSFSAGDYDAIAGATKWSMHAMVKFDSTGSYPIISKWGSGALCFEFYLVTNKLGIATGPTNITRQGATAVSLNVWHGCGARQTASALQVILDGVVDGSGAITDASIANTTSALRIASDDFGAAFADCKIAEVAIWDIDLSDAEFMALYKGVSPARIRRNHLKWYVPLYGVASPEADLSGNAKNPSGTGAAAAHPPVGRLAPFAG